MTEQAPAHLMQLLERRAEDVLACFYAARRQAEASQAHGHRLEQQNQALSAELASLKAADAERQARLAELEQQVMALETQRLELAEENRELDEQNRELEGHNHHLQERLVQAGAVESSLPRRARQSKGLSALMGHYRDPGQADPQQAPAGAGVQEPAAPEPPVQTLESVQPEQQPSPAPQALLEQWYGRYDSAFFKGHTRPLKVGIHEDLAALEPWPEKLVRRALACYVNLPRYLKAVRDGAERIDLDGQPAGQVDEGAASHARRKLERLQAERGKKEANKGKPHGDQDRGRGNQKRRAERPERKPKPRPKPQSASRETSQVPEAVREDPAERMQRKLDALMARHSGQ